MLGGTAWAGIVAVSLNMVGGSRGGYCGYDKAISSLVGTYGIGCSADANGSESNRR